MKSATFVRSLERQHTHTAAFEKGSVVLIASRKGERVPPFKGESASCPECNWPVIAKCGEIVVHHWAHEPGSPDCSLNEGESEWHMKWKSFFPVEWREVSVPPHRADVRSPRGFVIEIQHSSISCEEVAKRDAFWKGPIWVFNATEVFESGRLRYRDERDGGRYYWEQPRSHFFAPQMRPIWDLGDGTCLRLGRDHWRRMDWEREIDRIGMRGDCERVNVSDLVAEFTRYFS